MTPPTPRVHDPLLSSVRRTLGAHETINGARVKARANRLRRTAALALAARAHDACVIPTSKVFLLVCIFCYYLITRYLYTVLLPLSPSPLRALSLSPSLFHVACSLSFDADYLTRARAYTHTHTQICFTLFYSVYTAQLCFTLLYYITVRY